MLNKKSGQKNDKPKIKLHKKNEARNGQIKYQALYLVFVGKLLFFCVNFIPNIIKYFIIPKNIIYVNDIKLFVSCTHILHYV